MSEKNIYIRSSSAEFLIFEQQNKENGIEVRFEDGDLWLTQKAISELFNTTRNNITMHLQEIYTSLELEENSTSKDFLLVQKEGNREVKRNIKYYNLDAIISVGYKVNSDRAIQFRRWATNVLKEFSKKGYIIDKKRMENGTFLDEDYFEELLAEIREIRLSERRFYQKITDIYATAVDYDSKSPTTIKFFKKVQNKMHYAVSHETAAELIYNRADSRKENMGLTTWNNSPNGKILQTDVVVAKNYLSKEEMEDLERIVNAFLELAESRAKRQIPMTMEDWANRIDKYLLSDDRDILKDAGKISMEIAKDKALSEFEKYRIIQDKLYKSDFDKLMESSEFYESIIFATTNLAKIKKYKQILEIKGIELITIKDLDFKLDVDECGKDAIENAQIKAKAYYDATKIPSIGMDNCLYIEELPEEKQPGTHVRRVNGKELSDDEMIEYYTSLVKEYGGRLTAKWVYGLAVCDNNGTNTYTWSYDHFYLTDKVCELRNQGYPLDSISIIPMFNKYLVELTNEDKKQSFKEDVNDTVNFILDILK